MGPVSFCLGGWLEIGAKLVRRTRRRRRGRGEAALGCVTRDIKSNLCSLSATPPSPPSARSPLLSFFFLLLLFLSRVYIISFRVSCASFLGRHRRHLHGLEPLPLLAPLSPLLVPVITATREEEEEEEEEVEEEESEKKRKDKEEIALEPAFLSLLLLSLLLLDSCAALVASEG